MSGPSFIAIVASCLKLLPISLWRLWRFEIASLAETRKLDREQAKRIYYREFNNDDGPARRVPVNQYCERHGLSGKLLFWRCMAFVSLAAPVLAGALTWWVR